MSEVTMPRLSDTMEEGELARWLKNVGDPVEKGDVLAEIETDKATMDLEAFEAGVLEKQLVEAGTVVPIGTAVAIIGDGSSAGEPSAPDDAGSAAEGAEPADSAEGAEDEAASVEADSAETGVSEEPPPAAAPDTEEPATEPSAKEPVESSTSREAGGSAEGDESDDESDDAASVAGKLRMSPLARKMARDNGIDLSTIRGSGPGGRIVRADVEDAIAAAETAPKEAPQPKASTQPETSRDAGADIEEVPLSRIRKVTARRLTESQAVPHYFLTSVVDVERLLAFRAEVNAGLADSGRKVSVNDFVIKAVAQALREHPEANASWGEDVILMHRRINVGVAVATEAGLLVPVVKDTDRKTLSEIAGEVVELAGRARDGKLKLDEMSGGTFSVSNLGMFGIDEFTAMLNPPEAGILAVGAASPVPVLRGGDLVEVPKMKVTLTVDHRVMDGATAAAFLRDLKGILEQPLRIVV